MNRAEEIVKDASATLFDGKRWFSPEDVVVILGYYANAPNDMDIMREAQRLMARLKKIKDAPNDIMNPNSFMAGAKWMRETIT